MKKLTFLLCAIIFIVSACNSDSKKNDGSIDSKSLGFIEDDLSGDAVTAFEETPKYSEASPGTSKNIERAFENAPPLIPHSTVGIIPITKDMNMCLTCHLPENAKNVGSTPMSEAHFTEYRPKKPASDGELVVIAEEIDILDMARYSCTQCHITQSNATVNIENIFTPEFRNEAGKIKSNLDDNISEGVK